ncbi:RNA polymerase factor sigma-54 [uncultured Dysosmobacter sp.]|uniref:RNA polymerase factor sigma-54 n=1 Tax=uncultured Dysosmobacter sp. TaxID=2591384 RepID=UPI002622CA0F|nr:RNA polymerase factor sigma-54 [uncultured Dysosmobacter sp.]
MSLVSLKAELRQELKLTPQLLQSMEILQMNSQELLDYLGRAAEENPLLEQENASDLRSAYEELRQKASWIDGGVYGASFTHEDSELPERGVLDRETESLAAFLCDQLDRERLPKPLLALSKYIAELVDEDGYLAPEDLDGLLELKIPQVMIDQALEAVQGLEPAGVGARSLSECLLLQLARRKDISPAVLDIAARFLPELGRKHYGPISRELGLTVEEIQAAEKIISSLEPHPGRAFQPAEPTVYVRPDVFIVELDGELKAILNEYYLPHISISSYYVRLLKESDEKDTREYLRQKMQQAKWLLNSLERRGSTLRRCADAILAAQYSFFAGETAELAPMSLSSLADALELHPSTISRATRSKYLQCRQGTFPLRYFFSRAVGTQGPSRQAVKQKLLALVKAEDPRHPLSDQALCRMLSENGVQLARRTVAKYRMELGIGSSAARKCR